MHNVIVVDEEFESASQRIIATCADIDELIDKYLNSLQEVNRVGVVSGETALALREYVHFAEKLRDLAGLFAARHQTIATDFVNTIDETDSYFYD